MTKTLTKHGNSLALVIDKPVLELLHIDGRTPLSITTDGQVLIIAPERDAKGADRFGTAVAWANRRYGKALKKLAG
jgi:antitoxin component of MazEF toxin-antitoxin module